MPEPKKKPSGAEYRRRRRSALDELRDFGETLLPDSILREYARGVPLLHVEVQNLTPAEPAAGLSEAEKRYQVYLRAFVDGRSGGVHAPSDRDTGTLAAYALGIAHGSSGCSGAYSMNLRDHGGEPLPRDRFDALIIRYASE